MLKPIVKYMRQNIFISQIDLDFKIQLHYNKINFEILARIY